MNFDSTILAGLIGFIGAIVGAKNYGLLRARTDQQAIERGK
jgi:hypothetical protein